MFSVAYDVAATVGLSHSVSYFPKKVTSRTATGTRINSGEKPTRATSHERMKATIMDPSRLTNATTSRPEMSPVATATTEGWDAMLAERPPEPFFSSSNQPTSWITKKSEMSQQ